MVHDPRRDSRAQRDSQIARRQSMPTLTEESSEMPAEAYEEDTILVPTHFAPGSRFFDEMPQETDVDPLDWNEDHPLWLAFKKGDVRMVQMPDGSTRIIDKRDDVEHSINDLLPKQKFAKGGSVSLDIQASLAQLQFGLGKTMVSYAICPFVSGVSPLLTRPTQANGGVPPIGGAVLCGALEFGFEGAGETTVFDMPAGQVIKIPFAGSFGRLIARLWPKYYTPSDDGVAKIRTYLLFPAGPTLTSELWNSLPVSIMAQNGFANPNAQECRGWISEGIISNDLPRAPTRRFYGTVKADGVIADWKTICPIAFAATHVTLVGGAFDSANPTTRSLQFQFILSPTSGVAAPLEGPFDINQTVAIPNGCVGIQVFNSPNVLGGAAAVEIPFELIYSLSP